MARRRRYRIGGAVGIVVDAPARDALSRAVNKGIFRGIRYSGRQLSRIVRDEVKKTAPLRTGRLRRGIRGRSRRIPKGIQLEARLNARARSDGARYGYILNATRPYMGFVQLGYANALRNPRFNAVLRRNMQRFIREEWSRIRPLNINIKLFG